LYVLYHGQFPSPNKIHLKSRFDVTGTFIECGCSISFVLQRDATCKRDPVRLRNCNYLADN